VAAARLLASTNLGSARGLRRGARKANLSLDSVFLVQSISIAAKSTDFALSILAGISHYVLSEL
jgi:hypothetical protein